MGSGSILEAYVFSVVSNSKHGEFKPRIQQLYYQAFFITEKASARAPKFDVWSIRQKAYGEYDKNRT